MKDLGEIIYNNLCQFYSKKNFKIGISSIQINKILNKAGINKKNSNRDEILKIIKILKEHIEMANINLQNQVKEMEEEKKSYQKVFRDMESDNDVISKMNLDYIDNFTKLKEQDMKFQQEKKELLPINERIKEDNLINNKIIMIESKDVNKKKYPNSYNFSIEFKQDIFENRKGIINLNTSRVQEFILKECILKNTEKINFDYPYLLLEIPEIGNLFHTTDSEKDKCFIKLNLEENFRDKKYIIFKFDNEYRKKFTSTKNLDKISIKIRDYNGDILELENDREDISNVCLTFNLNLVYKNLPTSFI